MVVIRGKERRIGLAVGEGHDVRSSANLDEIETHARVEIPSSTLMVCPPLSDSFPRTGPQQTH